MGFALGAFAAARRDDACVVAEMPVDIDATNRDVTVVSMERVGESVILLVGATLSTFPAK